MAEAENQQNATEQSENVDEAKKLDRPPRAGSTRLHPFPMVHIVKPKVGKKPKITFDQVPELRRAKQFRMFMQDVCVSKKAKVSVLKLIVSPEVDRKLLRKNTKIDRQEKFRNDFKRTSQDFWRMELDRLSKIGDDNRRHMAAAIQVYLGQSRGSSKAIESLLRHVVES